MLKVEAVFGGLLALVVLGVAIWSVANTSFGGARPEVPVDGPSTKPAPVQNSTATKTLTSDSGQDLICECYDDAFKLAGSYDVTSAEYRTGFEQCRFRGGAQYGVDAGDAWTAGWNARRSGKAYEASCRAYKKRRG